MGVLCVLWSWNDTISTIGPREQCVRIYGTLGETGDFLLLSRPVTPNGSIYSLRPRLSAWWCHAYNRLPVPM